MQSAAAAIHDSVSVPLLVIGGWWFLAGLARVRQLRQLLLGIGALRGPDGVRVDQRLGEYVPERLGSDVLLALAAILGAATGTRIVKAQMVAAAADRLGLWRRHERCVPLLSELALGGNDL